MAKEQFQWQSDEAFFEPDDEGLFSRDIDGQLVRVVEATADDYDTDVRLKIDGQDVVVKKAVPLRDSQGNIIRDAEGKTIPRTSTIYDAAQAVFVKQPGDVNPIPTLCHKEHMRPVGVCRVCSVEVYRRMGDRRVRGDKLVPACHHQVEEGMEVQTIRSDNDPEAAERLRQSVRLLVELLAADHLPGGAASSAVPSELQMLASQLQIEKPRFAARQHARGQDPSSFSILVDHNACILCDRCVRACDDIKENHVIGRAGKGYRTTIGFDLNLPMRDSTCVSCGECAISCPTDALTFRPEVVQQQVAKLGDPGDGQVLTADELTQIPLFSGIPYKFLQFNGGAVLRRKLKAGQVLCEEGEYGSTAFIIESGRFEVFLQASRDHVRNEPAEGLLGKLGYLTSKLVSRGGRSRIRNDGGAVLEDDQRIIKTPEDVILGEMTCMNRYPRSATVVALEDAQVLEIRRNVLYMLQRNAVSRRILDAVYRQRALNSHLEGMALLDGLTPEQRSKCAQRMKDRVELIHVEPGQLIFEQGEAADSFYIVRLGFVKVTQRQGRDERVLNYLGPGSHFGEIGLLTALTDQLSEYLDSDTQRGRRTASCTALDHVELVRIRGDAFREMVDQFGDVRQALLDKAVELLKNDRQIRQQMDHAARPFLDQGLFNAHSLLVLDLESCTRCDECTRACADTHQGVTRLIREGLRFGNYLVASSCRSCLDPYCMVGCPVDAIHREGTLEIRIEDHCIGCGLCADNCPYGNINMHGFSQKQTDPQSGRKIAVVQQKATTCDLCRNVVGGQPSCVYACPHNAAHRMSGEQLFAIVEG